MSQRSEKYARNMERRVAHLEERVERINGDVTIHGVKLTTTAELLEAMAMPSYVVNADWEPSAHTVMDRRAARREARRKRAARRRVAALCMAALAVVLLLIVVTEAVGAEPDAPLEDRPVGHMATVTAAPDQWDGEDPLEAEKIEDALLAQGYFSDAVPLPYDLQDIMRSACEAYGCPYPLALAVAETESQFDQEAVGAVGEIGIMQLNPGPGGSYHAVLEKATGQDPATPQGNIVCGVYLLGKYMAENNDPAKAAMAYNMGQGGAAAAWEAGVTSTDYSAAVMEAMKRWEIIVG